MEERQPKTSETLGSYLRRMRNESGLNSRQVAALVGTDQSTLSRIEAGLLRSPKLEVLKRLADALDLDLAELFALCGVRVTQRSANLTDYLEHQAGYPLPDEAVAEIQAAMRTVFDKYRPRHDSSSPRQGGARP